MILLLIDAPRNPVIGTVGRSPTCVQKLAPETRISVETVLKPVPVPPVTKYTWVRYEYFLLMECCYHFIVIINIVSTAMIMSSFQEIRKVFNPSFFCINTRFILREPATCQDDCLLQLD